MLEPQLLLGDARTLMAEMEPESVDCIIADPPFNAGKDYGEDFDDDKPLPLYKAWLGERVTLMAQVLRPGGALWLMNETRNLGLTQDLLESCSTLEFQNIVVWAYGNPTPARDRFPKTWRPILFYRRRGKPKVWNISEDRLRRETLYCNLAHSAGRNLHDLWPDIPKLVGGYLAQPELCKKSDGAFAHVAQMPLGLADRMIRLSTNVGDLVLDPFVGSGTTCVAAYELGRRSIGLDLSADYLELARIRVSKATAPSRRLV